MPRFYIDRPLSVNQTLAVSSPLLRHINVLRMRVGEELILFNGQGGEYQGVIRQIGKSTAEIFIQAFYPTSRESPIFITLVQALSSADRMDYTIQKAVECGVSCIQPVVSLRSQHRFQGEYAQKKLLHWQAVATAASEQSGRTLVPNILPIQSLKAYLIAPLKTETNLLLSPKASSSLAHLPLKVNSIQVLIGPEGGLSEEEEHQAKAGGFTLLSLGPRVLRTETVAPVIMGVLQYRYGDLHDTR